MKVVLVVFHIDMWKLGMSNAVMHNGVAPIFALINVSVNLNALCQDVFSQCTSEHGLTLLLRKSLSGRALETPLLL